jgi:hypothetical protein
MGYVDTMASPRRALIPRGLRALQARCVEASWVAVVALPSVWASGCGRIGYDAIDVARDAASAPADASIDRRVEDAPEEEAAEAALDGAADASGDGSTDSESDADAADAACTPSAVADYCAGLPPLPAPPVIDGVLDCGPALRPMTPVDWNGPPPLPAFPAGNSTSLAAAWRPDGLYVFIAVTTPAAFPAEPADPVFYGAGVELFVEDDGVSASPPKYDNPGCIQLVVTAPTDATTTSRRAEGFRNAADQGPWASTQFGAFPSPTGFVFEGFVTAADLGLSTWALVAGGQIGFDVSVDVSFTTAAMTGPQGHRVGQYFLHVQAPVGDASTPTAPYQDPRAFCTPTLAPM